MLKISDAYIVRQKSKFGNIRFNLAVFLAVALIFSTSFTVFSRQEVTSASQAPSIESEILEYGYNISASESQNQDWQDRLYAPTYVTKINDMWFIVDCWHNRVIWSNDLFAPISQWKTMDDSLAGPHSIAYGGGYYAVEDTGRHQVIFYAFDEGKSAFIRRSEIKLGSRPHRIAYIENQQSFYILSSISQEMHRIELKNGSPALVNSQTLGFLEGQYTRSFTVTGDEMLFVSGAKKVVKTNYANDQYQVLKSYYVPPDFYGMNDIFYTGSKYILTSTLPNSIGVADTLEDIPTIKNQAKELGFKGRPYYVTQYGKALLIPEVAENSAVKIFQLNDAENLSYVQTIHDFATPTASSKARIFELPK